MELPTSQFSHRYSPGQITFGRGAVADLGAALESHGLERALVVCGRNVGANEAVMDPIRDGLGDRLAGVFDETTPEKHIETAMDGAAAVEQHDADAVIGLGAGSSLDIAGAISVLAVRDLSLDDIRAEVEETGTVALPDDGPLPLVAVPTTLAGADLSYAAGTAVPMGEERRSIVISGWELMPDELFYDPELFETTPTSVLTGSAINGFDKAVEALYSRDATPVTDATAIRALSYLRGSLPELADSPSPAAMERAVVGIVLAQYGVSHPEATKISVVHAFGQALRMEFGIQQGVAHGIAVPHALALLFDHVDASRDLLAEGLVEGETDDPAAAVVEAVAAVRDGMGLPGRLRDVDGPTKDRLGAAAKRVHDHHLLDRGPAGFDPTVEEIEAALEAAW